jgi:hypothetical protein
MNGSLEIECQMIQSFSTIRTTMAEMGSGFPIHQGSADTLTSADFGRMATNPDQPTVRQQRVNE